MSTRQAALELSGLGVSFGRRVILDGLDLCLPADGIDVLMGSVKTGKSTLLRTLSGLYQGHSLHKSWGDIYVHGAPVTPDNRPKLVHQHAKVLDLTLLQALLHPLRETEQQSPAGWRRTGLAWLTHFELEELIPLADQPLLHCAPRIQRCVQILSLAMLKPSLLLIDEPTYGLDDDSALWLLNWLKKLSPYCKLCIILHNQNQAKHLADRIVLIGGGRVLAHQTSALFFTQPANEWVAQFISTGNTSLPAPDAQPEELAEDIPPPPPLSPAAIEALNRPEVEHAAPARSTENNSGPSFKPAILVPDLVAERRSEENIRIPPSVIERRTPALLPASSRDGVELASTVGDFLCTDSSAPRGFKWIIPGKLAGCPAPGISAPIDYDLALLYKVGITRLITLTENDLDQSSLQRNFLSNMHLPIYDREAPSILQTHMLLVRMQKFIEAGEVLAVHCKAGLGRTGTILAAWLIRDGGLTAEVSIQRLRRIEPGFIQSPDQEAFLQRYEADLTQRLL